LAVVSTLPALVGVRMKAELLGAVVAWACCCWVWEEPQAARRAKAEIAASLRQEFEGFVMRFFFRLVEGP
jgi:hypothetical protein